MRRARLLGRWEHRAVNDASNLPPIPPVAHPLDAHPLDALSAAEIAVTKQVLADAGLLGEGGLVSHIVADEPDKVWLARWRPGDPVRRRTRALIIPGPELTMIEAIVSISEATVVEQYTIEGMRPALTMTEAMFAVQACLDHPDYVAALARRGVTDLSTVQIDPWPAGAFGLDAEVGRRISRCISFIRETPSDNGYARPVEGLLVHVDMGRHEVIEVIDHGVTTLPVEHARYDVESVAAMSTAVAAIRPDLRPIVISQPDGPSFTITGNLIEWQGWSARIGFDPAEGIVLHQVTIQDGDLVRSVAHRLSVSEMIVPYGDPGPVHGWKNAFDAGEWGLGRMTQSLELGCDCLGDITYLDAVMANEQGDPWVVRNAICIHEEDTGIGWKHVDLWSGGHETRRGRRLVISHIATVGNYEYAFYWALHLDGMIQLEVKLTGIMSPMAIEPGSEPPFAVVVAPGIAAPVHQHLFCVRLDLDVDGPDNTVVETNVEAMPMGPANPWGNAFRAEPTVLATERVAQRTTNAATSRSWKVLSSTARNRLGQPTGYKLMPTMATPTLLAHPDSPIGRRAAFAQHNLWVTPYRADERRAAGEFPNQHVGGAGLPAWTAQDRDLRDTDIVLWYCFGVTHIPRPEDWPVMPVEVTGFLLLPVGFFDRNPALDVPPTSGGACHTG